MRVYLLVSPPWVVGLFCGVIFGAGFAAVARLSAPSPVSGQVVAVVGVVAGVVIGGALAYAGVRRRREVRAAAGELPAEQQLVAYRAAIGGQVPADPFTRAAAVRIAHRRIEELRPFRIVTPVVIGLLTLGIVMRVVAGQYLVAGLLLVPALVNGVQLYEPRRIRRQLQRLAAGSTAGQNS